MMRRFSAIAALCLKSASTEIRVKGPDFQIPEDGWRSLCESADTIVATVLARKDGKIEKLNTKTPETISAVVYPQWSVDGRFIAFSVNDIAQVFHSTNPNRTEVYDYESDIVVYDVERHEIISTALLMRKDTLETFPTFSPDGRWLMYTETAYGCFPIWHKDSDIFITDLKTGETKALEGANSEDVDSYHSWSSNGRWVVFSSRRVDGLYTRPYITHIDDEGNATKPFVLPQKDPGFYKSFLKSYNIPEFVNGKPGVSEDTIADVAINDSGIDISFRGL